MRGVIALCSFLVCVIAVPLSAQESQEQQQMMEIYMKLAQPGEHHEHLKPLAGKWKQTSKHRQTPEMAWETWEGESTAEWILGGRFLMVEVTGPPMMGAPADFEGVGIMGYDNGAKQYTFVWMDSFGTMTLMSEGSCDGSGKVITYESKMKDPASGMDLTMRSVYTIESADKYTIEMYMAMPGVPEFLSMEMTNTRMK
ncbi:MAG: DUF1579 family protein [Candidatus Latescibacterota bacterium]|nr:MAG: DUF1579 family protein [Candidatus Latescibacterota bacterium]